MIAVIYQLLPSMCLLKCGIQPGQLSAHTRQLFFISVSRKLLYEFVCFPTLSLFCNLPKIERNMSTYQHAKKQKELARQTSFDPIFRHKFTQKIVLRGFVIRCFPSQSSKIDANV